MFIKNMYICIYKVIVSQYCFAFNLISQNASLPAPTPGILYKSIAGRYRPSYPDGPITVRYRFIKNAYWAEFIRILAKLSVKESFSCNFNPSHAE